MTSICTIFAIATSEAWSIHQMDVKTSFLHRDLKEEIYIRFLLDVAGSSPNDVCWLKRTLFALKQVPRAWFKKFRQTLLSLSFVQSQYDPLMFLHKTSTSMVDIVITYVNYVFSFKGLFMLSFIRKILKLSHMF